jgi:acyl-CoA thioesterase 8
MSDSYFIGTVSRIHNLWRFARPNLPPNPKSPLSRIAAMEATEIKEGVRGIVEGRLESSVGMMVSLDHTIYFHRPREIKADEWLCAEMESPWAGEGRGLVLQKIWNRQGKLVASCVQEVSYLFSLPLCAVVPLCRNSHLEISRTCQKT